MLLWQECALAGAAGKTSAARAEARSSSAICTQGAWLSRDAEQAGSTTGAIALHKLRMNPSTRMDMSEAPTSPVGRWVLPADSLDVALVGQQSPPPPQQTEEAEGEEASTWQGRSGWTSTDINRPRLGLHRRGCA